MEQTENGKIIVVSHAEGFLVKGLLTKFEEHGLKTEYAGTDLQRMEALREESELYVLFVDDDPENMTEALVFLKDIASDNDRKIVLIGTIEQLEIIRRTIPDTLILAEFTRPLDMEKLIRVVSQYMDAASGENRKKHILIVDDDITYMRLIYEWLSPYYHVGMASSGVQAIKYLAKNKADLVLLDYEMPVVNGPQVLEMLRSDTDSGSLPVMFLTGKGDRESVLSIVDLKPVDYLLKTIDRESLKAKIDDFFQKKR
jgi:CheY-like chemotaxis protein